MNSSNLAASLSPKKSGTIVIIICQHVLAWSFPCVSWAKSSVLNLALCILLFAASKACAVSHPRLQSPLHALAPGQTLHRKFRKKSTPRNQAFFSLRFRSCSHWRIPLTWVDAKISVVRTMWSYFKSNLHSQTRKRASQFWSKATWLQKWTTPTSVAKLVQV